MDNIWSPIDNAPQLQNAMNQNSRYFLMFFSSTVDHLLTDRQCLLPICLQCKCQPGKSHFSYPLCDFATTNNCLKWSQVYRSLVARFRSAADPMKIQQFALPKHRTQWSNWWDRWRDRIWEFAVLPTTIYWSTKSKRMKGIWFTWIRSCRMLERLTLSTRSSRSPGLIRPILNTGPCGRILVTISGNSPPPRNVKPKQPFSRSTVICANFDVTHRLFCETE